MATVLVFQEVEDVDRWIGATDVRDRFFAPLGITARLFRDPAGSNRVGMIVNAPSLEIWQQAITKPAVVEALGETGAKTLTAVTLVEP
jgi:hypothetical protein